MKLLDDHPAWPWIIEYAGQTLHMFHINRADGLTPSQIIRGKTCTTPRARIGEKVLYKTMKTLKLNDDTEKRWRYGIWLGVIDTSGEHIIGTADGKKCRAVAQIANDKKFDARFFAAITGTQWRPSPRHNSWKFRTCVDGDEHLDEVPEVSYVVKSDMNGDVEEAMKIIRESKRIIQERAPTSHSFHITQSDIARYGASVRCNGCQYVLGRIPYQVAHTADCRKRIMDMMREDPEDRLSPKMG